MYTKNAVFSKSNLELWSLLTTNRKFYTGLSKNLFFGPLGMTLSDNIPHPVPHSTRFSQKLSNVELLKVNVDL